MNANKLAQVCANEMFTHDTVSREMGMSIEHMSYRESDVSMRVTANMLNGHKTCHGGMIFSLADSAFAFACNSENEAAVASACSIDFLRPARENDVLTAHAAAMHQGRRTGVYIVNIVNQKQELVAIFKGTSARLNQAVLPTESKE
ncbi:phenylacetic acid degradation protein PaaD [Enterovibrio norvegicus]|uniref:Acyl-CoA thioesterase n=2 Tax=Enterovibrio norvegicus TaxID=188144 RepID=A0A1I5UFT5_9GAMM|nr:hydroxyphenylacetyl-CoA thioesterase PaaI [Enterovibrio norvegicus]MCC4796739.1 hydroxyphenylacetyl-CoA thioesterase PaaI [Enterovibrio norvegicus]OEE52818.1 phenylacetic acid degradation protein PaaD [Enterovibrio norvegicus]OEF55582.1 phenylacetic acid degradation protein PaaD [Enterovibrio norvegicus]OEF63735.1 phenylacetic acid degradation protein PaaD [Enterovibrio norvegicus]PMH62694.1 phenylacetic acid degradation protein PaaD [Enterovibrio norvegicus]